MVRSAETLVATPECERVADAGEQQANGTEQTFEKVVAGDRELLREYLDRLTHAAARRTLA